MTCSRRTQLAALKDALAAGVSSVTVDGVSTTFRTQQEMQETVARLERELGFRRPRNRVMTPYMGHR